MYNPSYQPSFGQQQQQQVQSQYRGFQKTFQPTGNVQSFYQQQPVSSYGMNTQAQNYHMPSYAGNRQGHDVYLREDSTAPSSFNRGQSYGTFSNIQGSQQANIPMSQPSGGFQGADSFHTANYVGNRQDHDASLRADSVRPSSYAAGRMQGPQGSFNQNISSNPLSQGQSFIPYRNF